MTVRVEDGTVFLVGRCPAADAEDLLVALGDTAAAVVDVSGAVQLHLAVVQVLRAARAHVRGVPASPFLAAYVCAAAGRSDSGEPGLA